MIKTRLVRLLAHARKYIVYQILWQWAALWAQIVMIFTLTGTMDKILKNEWKGSEDFPRGSGDFSWCPGLKNPL